MSDCNGLLAKVNTSRHSAHFPDEVDHKCLCPVVTLVTVEADLGGLSPDLAGLSLFSSGHAGSKVLLP